MKYPKQKNITVTDEQQVYIRENIKIMPYRQLAENAGISYDKLKNNHRLMGLSNLGSSSVPLPVSDGFFQHEKLSTI